MRHSSFFAAVALLGVAAAVTPPASHACSLVPVDPVRIKQLMAQEIGYRLGLGARQFPLSAITTPELHTPYGLDSLCRGLGAFHHSAGFRYAEGWRVGPGPWLPGTPQPESAPGGKPWPPYAQCTYEGVAVVLGHGESSPVAVHFTRKCS